MTARPVVQVETKVVSNHPCKKHCQPQGKLCPLLTAALEENCINELEEMNLINIAGCGDYYVMPWLLFAWQSTISDLSRRGCAWLLVWGLLWWGRRLAVQLLTLFCLRLLWTNFHLSVDNYLDYDLGWWGFTLCQYTLLFRSFSCWPLGSSKTKQSKEVHSVDVSRLLSEWSKSDWIWDAAPLCEKCCQLIGH